MKKKKNISGIDMKVFIITKLIKIITINAS
jgi:hypothetical protein